MNLIIRAIRGRNITLVYHELKPSSVDTNGLKTKVFLDSSPVIVDTPDMVFVTDPKGPTLVQFGQNSIRVTAPEHVSEEKLEDSPIWRIAFECAGLVPDSASQLRAYGVNFDLEIAAEDGSFAGFLVEQFISDQEHWKSILEGKISSFVPRLIYDRSGIRHDLVLRPDDSGETLLVHMNAHVEKEGIELPSEGDLRRLYIDEHGYLVATLRRLFGEA